MRKVVLFQPNDLNLGYLDPGEAVWNYLDARHDDRPISCVVCEQESWLGYHCMDGGEEICSDCAEIVPAWLGYQLRDENAEAMSFRNRLVAMRSLVGISLTETFAARLAPNKLLGWTIPWNEREARESWGY